MGKLIRVVAALVAIVVVLVVVLAVALPFLIDPNDYKDKIAGAVRDQTGRELSIEGDIGLSVFPWLGLDIGATRLSNAPGFGDQPFAEVKDVQVRLKLLPLLRKEVEMDTVVLDGLHLYLAKNAQGTSNWADLAGEGDQAEKPETDDAAGAALAGLAIGGVKLTDARVIWDDQAAGARYAVEDLNLISGAITPGEAVDLELTLQLSATAPVMEGAVNFGGAVWVSESLQQIKLNGMDLRVDLKGDTLPGGALDARLTSDVAVDLEKQTLTLPELVLKALGLTVTANLDGTAIMGEEPTFTGNLKVREFVPREVMQTLAIEPPVTADPTVLGKADLQFAMTASPKAAQLKGIQLRLDDSKITGQVSVSNFAAPAVRFDVALDEIDADRYLPPPPPDAAPKAAPPTAAAAAGAAQLPLETLRALDINGTAKIAKLKAFQLRSTDVLVTLKAKDGVVRVHPAQARLYQGSYSGDMTFDVRQDTPRVAMDEKVAGVQAGPLLQDLMGDDRLTGEANVQAKLSGRGVDPETLRKTLNGNLAFSFTDGQVKGVDLAGLIAKAQALLKGQPAPTDTGPKETKFTELKGTATVKNGLVTNNDLSAKSPFLRVSGEGTTHLAKETIDYLITTKIVGTAEGQGGAGLGELKGLAIPVKVGGTYAQPTYQVKLDKVLADKAKAKLQEKLDEKKGEAKQKVEDKLKDQLGDKLKGLFR